jgi:dipeptidase E
MRPEDTSVVVIPTASNFEDGDKEWYIDDLINLKNQNFKMIDIADISTEESIWKHKLEKADVLYFEGGNSFHLMNWVNRSGLTVWLSDLLKNKVYVGVSAGSMITCPDLLLKESQVLYEEDLDKTDNMTSLNLVNFYFLPHYNSEYFTNLSKTNIKNVVRGITSKIYAMDDSSAIKIDGEKIEIISEGEYLEFN